MALPYTLKAPEGGIAWYDSRIDLIVKNQEICQGIDNGCTFYLSPESGTITVTKVKDEIIEANFEGRAGIVRTGLGQGPIDCLFHEAVNDLFIGEEGHITAIDRYFASLVYLP